MALMALLPLHCVGFGFANNNRPLAPVCLYNPSSTSQPTSQSQSQFQFLLNSLIQSLSLVRHLGNPNRQSDPSLSIDLKQFEEILRLCAETMEGDFSVDLSSLNLLSEVALLVQSEVMSLGRFDGTIKKRASSSPAVTKFDPHHRIDDFGSDRYSWDVLVGASTQKLMEFEIMKKKGSLADLEKGFLIPKKTRSKLPLRAEKKRSKLPMRTDLLGFIPKKKRSKLASHQNRTNNMKRKRLYSAEHDDQNTNIQIQGVKRQKTTAHYLDSLQVSSSLPLGMPSHSQEITNKISSHVGVGDKPLWSFQRKSQLRFSLIKLNVSSRTTMVS